MDVLSNLPFLVVGVAGCAAVWDSPITDTERSVPANLL